MNIFSLLLIISAGVSTALFAVASPPQKYIIIYIVFAIGGIILLLSKDKSLIAAWSLLFFTAVNRGKGIISSPYSNQSFGISVFSIFLLVSVLILLFTNRYTPVKLHKLKKILFFYFCYLGVNLFVSLRYSIVINISLLELFHHLSFIFLILFWERISRESSDARRNDLLLILFFIGAFEGILAIAQVFFHIDMSFWGQYEMSQVFMKNLSRAEGSVGSYTGLGNYLAILFPFILSNFLYKNSNLKLFCLLLTGTGLVLTFTRISWMGAFIGSFFIIVYLLQKQKISFGKILFSGGISLILLLIIFLILHEKVSVIVDNLLLSRGDTFSSRLETYKTAWNMIEQSNFIGIGLRNYNSILMNKYFFSTTALTAVHNSYLWILVESGIMGLFFFLAIYISSITTGRWIIKKIDSNSLAFYTIIGMIGSIISFLICSFLNMTNTYYNSMNLLWNITAIGLIYGISELKNYNDSLIN